jgi:hypothetical protein
VGGAGHQVVAAGFEGGVQGGADNSKIIDPSIDL